MISNHFVKSLVMLPDDLQNLLKPPHSMHGGIRTLGVIYGNSLIILYRLVIQPLQPSRLKAACERKLVRRCAVALFALCEPPGLKTRRSSVIGVTKSEMDAAPKLPPKARHHWPGGL